MAPQSVVKPFVPEKAPIKPEFDFIARTKKPRDESQDEKLIFFDDAPALQPGVAPTGLAYEESTDAAQLYNPLTGTVKSTALSGTRVFPAFMNPGATAASKGGLSLDKSQGRMQP